MSASVAARLLVVDDIPANRELLVRRLQRFGHAVAQAEGGRQALEMLGAEAFDLVLLDITMPEVDGYQVLESIRSDAALRHLPVVMVSALDEIDSVVRCLELGADDYLTKPFNPLILRARVDASLAKKRLRDVERLQLHEMAHELEIGRRIQAGFLPAVLPQPQGWCIEARFVPARQVGGDFYDVFVVRDGRIALVVADVCDKGVGAALYMALFRSLIRAAATYGAAMPPIAGRDDAALLHTIRTTNDYIADVHGDSNMFATAFVGLLDPADGGLRYVNAGHDPPFVVRGGALERLPRTGPALGLFAGTSFEVAETRVAPGEHLLVFTDGVTDAGGPEGAFGEEGLAALLTAGVPAASVLEAIGTRLDRLGTEPWDDVTMLHVRRAG